MLDVVIHFVSIASFIQNMLSLFLPALGTVQALEARHGNEWHTVATV